MVYKTLEDNMKIFKAELLDGLSEKIKASSSVAITSEILVNSDSAKSISKEEIEKTLAGYGFSNPDQVDLYYLNSVLVSTGWNKNDDVFDTVEVWGAKDSPVDKQFNYMHNENDIIGHITGSTIYPKPSDDLVIPEKFDIITSAVLYKSWSDPELKERMDQLISEIEEKKWAVSMECLFSDFDYSVVSPDGVSKVVARNEDSAFLTKHLRVYGGKGEYEGYKVGRLLRSISFSGKGLVDNPANPRSVILSSEEDPFEQEPTKLNIKEFEMAKPKEVKIPEVIAASVTEEVTVETDERDVAIADLKQTVSELEGQVASAQESEKGLKTELDTVKAELVTKDGELTAALATIRTMVRTSQVKDAGISEDKIKETLAKFDSVDDEAFAAMLDLVKVQANVFLESQTHADNQPVPVPEPAPEPELEPEPEEVVASDLEDLTSADVETVASVISDDDTSLNEVFSATANYFRNSVLSTTKNLK